MDPTDIGLFHLAEQRLAWADRRQALLAQNVANANTPGYRARDAAPFAFDLAAAGLANPSLATPTLANPGTLARTAPNHIAHAGGRAGGSAAKPAPASPNGNAVALEDQLGRVADTASMQELTINLMRGYQTMLRTALGRAG